MKAPSPGEGPSSRTGALPGTPAPERSGHLDPAEPPACARPGRAPAHVTPARAQPLTALLIGPRRSLLPVRPRPEGTAQTRWRWPPWVTERAERRRAGPNRAGETRVRPEKRRRPEAEPSAAGRNRAPPNGLRAQGVGLRAARAMAAEGTSPGEDGAVGGRSAQDSLRQSKCPAAAPNRRRGSAQSRDAERRAHQWCREYLGGAWRRARPEELRVHPVRWEGRGRRFGARDGVGVGWPSGHSARPGTGPGFRTAG